jgi:hypothetical protein
MSSLAIHAKQEILEHNEAILNDLRVKSEDLFTNIRGENISDEKTKKRERTKKNEKNEEKRKERNLFSAHFFEKTEQKASFRAQKRSI